MPPRQPFPIRGGMPQHLSGFGRNQMRPMMNPARMGNMGMTRGPMGVNASRGMRGTTRNSGGGLLAKILGKGNSQGAQAGMQMFGAASRSAAPATSGGLLKTLTDPSAITGFLNNTQRVLNTAQQIGPMVQQYGPIIKNLPAMWKLYRGLNAASSDEETTNDVDVESANTKQKTKAKIKTTSSELVETDEEEVHSIEIDGNKSKRLQGKSVPKIYV